MRLCGSLSVIVAVWMVAAPAVALMGVPRVTMTVSPGSFTKSSSTVMVIGPLVAPAGMTSGLAVMV